MGGGEGGVKSNNKKLIQDDVCGPYSCPKVDTPLKGEIQISVDGMIIIYTVQWYPTFP